MNGRELKTSILQMAMQGKLVPQDENDEPASALIKQIDTQRTLLSKKGKNKIIKTTSSIDEDEQPYDIPSTWEWIRFGDLVNFSLGKTPARADDDYWKEEVPWVSISDMSENGIVLGTREKISKKAFEKFFNGNYSPKGTLIMSFKLTVGRVSILGVDAVHNEAIISIFPIYDQEDTIKNYLFKILPIISNSSGDIVDAIKGKTLNRASITNMLVPLPPLEEQNRIVEKLEELLPLVEDYSNKETSRVDLDKKFPMQLRNSILQEAVQGKLVPQNPKDEPVSLLIDRIIHERKKLTKNGKIRRESISKIERIDNSFYEKSEELEHCIDDELPFEIPESWCWSRLNTLTFHVGSKQNQIKTNEMLTAGKFPVVSQGQALIDGYCNDASKVIKETPLIMFGDHTRNVKYIDFSFIIGADGTKFHKCISINPKYLYYWMKYAVINLPTRGYARHYSQLCKTFVPVPPLQEQERIVNKIEELLPLIEM